MAADHAYVMTMFKYVRLIISALLARHRLRASELLKHLKGMVPRQLMNRRRQLMNILSTSDYSEIKPALNLSTKDRDHLSRVHEHHAVYARTPLWNTREDELWDSVAPNKRCSQHLALRKVAMTPVKTRSELPLYQLT